MNKIFDTNDSINFGQMKNESFKWIYRLSLPYFIWLIEETDICFSDLSIFYQFGKPLRIDKNSLTKFQENRMIDLIKELGTNSRNNNSLSILLTIDIITNLISERIISANQFKEFDFAFSEITLALNNSKLENCCSCFNRIDFERDKYLAKLFIS